MTLALLKRQIKRYSNDAVRFKAKADRFYAAWKQSGDKYDYIRSQQNFENARRAKEICMEYRRQLAQQQRP